MKQPRARFALEVVIDGRLDLSEDPGVLAGCTDPKVDFGATPTGLKGQFRAILPETEELIINRFHSDKNVRVFVLIDNKHSEDHGIEIDTPTEAFGCENPVIQDFSRSELFGGGFVEPLSRIHNPTPEIRFEKCGPRRRMNFHKPGHPVGTDVRDLPCLLNENVDDSACFYHVIILFFVFRYCIGFST